MGRPERRRVAVTGLGVVSAAGIGIEAYFEGLCSAAPVGDRRVTGFDPNDHFDSPKEARRSDPYTQFLVAAADQALGQAGDIEADPTRCGAMIGTGVGGITTLEQQIGVFQEKGPRRVSPFLVPMMMA
ncbi:MAG: beta-ketoacyl synthase, partial [Acidimicrobiaceae bacterium]|nr:beta-ketoacyl synthase [Acidimicrobiaceae bacterium]